MLKLKKAEAHVSGVSRLHDVIVPTAYRSGEPLADSIFVRRRLEASRHIYRLRLHKNRASWTVSMLASTRARERNYERNSIPLLVPRERHRWKTRRTDESIDVVQENALT